MPSTLGRLFVFAKAPNSSAIENFTTEALAGAIRADPRPLVVALDRRDLIQLPQVTEVDVLTQVVLPGTGILDLVVAWKSTAVPELWIEVKVDAAESGHQLDAYALAASSRSPTPRLLTLGKRPLRSDSDVGHLYWQDLRRAIVDTVNPSPFWTDFRQFMAELEMADDFDEPISAAESASLAPAFSMSRKAVRILASTVDELRIRWPAFGWPSNADAVRDEALKKFTQKGRLFVVGATRSVLYPMVGFDRADEGTMASVWLETKLSGIGLQGEMFRLADIGSLGPTWQRNPGRWGNLQATSTILELGEHRAIVAWYIARLTELDQSGLLALAIGAPSAPVDEIAPATSLEE